MTLYDLHCKACDAYFEAWQDREAKGPFRCRVYGQKKACRTILKPPAFHAHYSPLHPRAGRGKGIGRFRK